MYHAMSKNRISGRMIKSEGEMWWSGVPHGKHMVRVRSTASFLDLYHHHWAKGFLLIALCHI